MATKPPSTPVEGPKVPVRRPNPAAGAAGTVPNTPVAPISDSPKDDEALQPRDSLVKRDSSSKSGSTTPGSAPAGGSGRFGAVPVKAGAGFTFAKAGAAPKESKEAGSSKPVAKPGGPKEGNLTFALQIEGEWRKNYFGNLTSGLLDIQKSKSAASDAVSINIKQATVTSCSRGTGKMLIRVEPKEGSVWWLEFADSSERDNWLNAFEAHGATPVELFKEGLLSVEVPGLVKKFKPRWFELRSDLLQYFKSATETELLGTIPLTPHTTVEAELDDKAGLTFSLAPNGDEGVKRTKLGASTKPERMEWAQAVSDVVAKKDATVNPNSEREGYLLGGWKKNALKKWFFILLPDKLQWFKSLADAPANPLGEVLLPAGAHVGAEDDGVLNVAPTGDEDEKLFYVNAQIPEECVSWHKTFSSLIATKSFTKNPKSIKEGYLNGSKKLGTTGNRRYFVLLPDQLQYFTHRADEKPEGTIDLDGGSCVEVEEEGVMKHYSALSPLKDVTSPTHRATVSEPPPKGVRGRQLDKAAQEAMAAKLFRAPPAAEAKPQPATPNKAVAEKLKIDTKLTPGPKKKQDYWVFGVAPTGDEGEKWYYITVADDRLRTAWVTAINKLISSKPFKVHPNSLSEGYAQCGLSKKSMKTRYLILLPDRLMHFKCRGEWAREKPGSVDLPSGAVCEMDNEEDTMDNVFLVAPTGDEGAKPFYIAPNNPKERDMWISVIEELLASKEKKQNSESLKEGYLYAGDKKVGQRKYFCILLKDRMQYFKARKDAKPAGEVPLPPGFHYEVEDIPGGKKMLFVLAPTFDESESMFYFCAKTADERRSWMSVLKALAATKNSQVVPDSKKEGYLWIQLGLMKKLQKRYCVLMEDKLLYFKGRNDKKEGGFFALPPGAVQQLPAEGEDLGDSTKHVFFLSPTGDEGEVVNVLAADYDNDRLDWMKAILAVLQTKNTQTNDKSLWEGYLNVGKKKDSMRKRYCVLLEDKFEFFKSRNDTKAEDAVPLSGGAEVEDDQDEKNEKYAGFTVAQSGDEGETIYYLSAANPSLKKACMEKLSILLAKKDSTKTKGSLREGYLMVGPKKGQHKRYCVLLQNSLLYYKSRQDQKEAGVVDLPSGATVETGDDAGPLEFYVASTGDANAKKLYCTARDEVLKDGWMATIDELIQSKETKQHASSLREGYLLLSMKRDVPSSGYKKRFAALFQDKLQLYVGRRDKEPECEILLPGGAHCEEEPGDHLIFSVAPTGDASEKYYFLKAKTHADQAHWLKSLRDIIDVKDSKKASKSLMEGYLNGGFSRKTGSQQRFYFVLMDDRLEYFKSRNGQKAAGEVLLPGGFVIDAVEQEDVENPGDENSMFFVAPSGDAKVKPFYCTCKDGKEMARWTSCLLNLQDTKISKVNPYSVKEGYMRGATKLTTSDSLLYFILTNDQLEYFTSRNDKQAAGTLPIPGGSAITYVDTEKPNTIEIATCEDDGATRFYMTGRDHRELKSWATAFALVIDDKSPMRFASSIVEGYLFKRGFRKSSKRYVIVSDKQLAYFVSKHDPKPKGVLDITPTTKLEKGEKTDFIIESPGSQTKFHFECDDEKTFPTWYSAIEGAVAGKPKLFEGLLSDAMKRTKNKTDIPWVARQCITYITEKGLETEGIFRVPGNNDTIQHLRKTFEAQVDDAPVDLQDVHSAAGLFKLYWRMLAQPVVPFEHYDKFIAVDDGLVAADQAKCEKLSALIATLPELNQRVLAQICRFLKAVSEHSSVNKMHSQNCAMVFAPSLIRQPEGDAGLAGGAAQAQKMVLEMEQAQRLIQTMIDGYDKIFAQVIEGGGLRVAVSSPKDRKLSNVGALSPSIKNAPTRATFSPLQVHSFAVGTH